MFFISRGYPELLGKDLTFASRHDLIVNSYQAWSEAANRCASSVDSIGDQQRLIKSWWVMSQMDPNRSIFGFQKLGYSGIIGFVLWKQRLFDNWLFLDVWLPNTTYSYSSNPSRDDSDFPQSIAVTSPCKSPILWRLKHLHVDIEKFLCGW